MFSKIGKQFMAHKEKIQNTCDISVWRNDIDTQTFCFLYEQTIEKITQCGLVTAYSDMNLDQYWLR